MQEREDDGTLWSIPPLLRTIITESYLERLEKTSASHSRLTRAQEKCLIERYQTSDHATQRMLGREIIEAFDYLVFSQLGVIGKRHRAAWLCKDDLIQVGRMTVLKTLGTYRVTSRMNFFSFAYRKVYAAMRKFLFDAHPIHIADAMQKDISDLHRLEYEYRKKGIVLTKEGLAARLGITDIKLTEIRRAEAALDVISLDEEYYVGSEADDGYDQEPVTIGEMLVSTTFTRNNTEHEVVRQALAQLPLALSECIELRYGFRGVECSIERVGKRLHIPSQKTFNRLKEGEKRLRALFLAATRVT